MKYPRFREEIIVEYIKGKTVLDIGCVSNQKSGHPQFGKLHSFLRDNAKEVTGVDYNKKGVDTLRKKGYNIVFGNAENFKIKQKFDVVIAGELIEHLSNQGLFIDNISKVMKKRFKIHNYNTKCICIQDYNKVSALWHSTYK